MLRKYRELTQAEIAVLEANQCLCPDWKGVKVAEGFNAATYRNVRLMGDVRLGANDTMPCGVYNAMLKNCTIGDNVLISNIQGVIVNYDIGDGAHIENVGSIVCDGTGNFGNGVEVRAVNEAGGREVVIFDSLSAQFAYMMAMYRHSEKLTFALREIALAECAKISKTRGRIGTGAMLAGCGKLYNVNIGDYATLAGTATLRNGTVLSSKEAPSFVGSGVKAYDFIVAQGARVDNGAVLERCFVGENCRMDHYFSATDCLFFSNSDVANGEACSVFAGPFTVSHHRSSLLIAGYFSFFNAGSGSNQSNHLFKTGAVHQGIHERGCKFGSNAYVMLPAREGAFSVVMGRHTSHHDTKDLPYSYLVEEDGKTYVIPGASLRSSGSARDFAKWPARDKRTLKRDRIHYAENNPYVGEKLLSGIGICERLLEKEGADVHTLNRIKIKTPLLKRGLGLYQLALKAALGEVLSWIGEPVEVTHRHWVDMAGMFAPGQEILSLISKIETGSIDSVENLEAEFDRIASGFEDYSKAWALMILGEKLGRNPEPQDIESAIIEGMEAASTLAGMRSDDAVRDNEKVMTTGYGIDSFVDSNTEQDFLNVRNAQQKK